MEHRRKGAGSACRLSGCPPGALCGRVRRGASSRAGFTLLEVMVAVAILGLALTVILSSQAGLFSSATHATHLTSVVNLARCRMNETELELLKNGYPLIDQTEEGKCCGDDLDPVYECEWKVERVELPEVGSLGDAGVLSGEGEGESEGMLSGPLGALADMQKNPGGSLGAGAGLEDLAGLMAGGDQAGGGIAAMMMGMVYPDLKPMLEASIRKVTVTVRWKEGRNERNYTVVQYVTDPMQGGLDQALREEGLLELDELKNPGSSSSSPSPGAGVP